MNAPTQQQTIIIQNHGNTGFGTAGLIFSILGWFTCGLLSPIGALLSFFGLLGRGAKSHAIAGLLVGFPGVIFLFTIGFGILASMLGLGAVTTAAITQAQRNVEQNRKAESEVSIPPSVSDATPADPVPATTEIEAPTTALIPEQPAIAISDPIPVLPVPNVTTPPIVTPKTHPMRTWTAKNGKFTTQAKLVSIDDFGKITIEKEDGKQVTLDIEKLCDADNDYVKSLSN